MVSPTPDPDLTRVAIVGAGPAGCVLALLLARQPCRIDVYDYRPDPRLGRSTRARSINLALSTRGLTALQHAGVLDKVTKCAVPMHGRCIHTVSASLHFHPYGQDNQHLLSVSRVTLSNILLDACDQSENVNLHFQTKCVDVDLRTPSLTLQHVDPEGVNHGQPEPVAADLVVGADGAFSRVRAAMSRQDRFNFSQSYIPAAYKELSMKTHAFQAEWLHIWPRHQFMLIALPNMGGAFTCTLFMDKSEFDKLSSPKAVQTFFEKNFPDAVRVMPSLVDDFFRNPTPSLVTIRCSPYNYIGNAVLIGDAAHAIVPFYGQGCNAAFEDCRLLSKCIEEHGWSDLHQALSAYAQERKVNADAIADLAIDHYEDMSSRSAKPYFVLKRRLEILANRVFPKSFLPLYSMVSFSNIPYAEAVRRAEKQDKRLEQFIKTVVAASVSTAALVALMRAWKPPR